VCGGKGEEVRHENKDLEVMFWQLKGDVSLKIDDGQQYQVKEGDIYLLKKGLGYTETVTHFPHYHLLLRLMNYKQTKQHTETQRFDWLCHRDEPLLLQQRSLGQEAMSRMS